MLVHVCEMEVHCPCLGHVLVVFACGLVVYSARGIQFCSCRSGFPATTDSFVSLSIDPPLFSFGGSLVAENIEVYLESIGDIIILCCKPSFSKGK